MRIPKSRLARAFVLSSLAMLAFPGSGFGQSETVAYWNFNALSIASASPPGAGGVPTSLTADLGSGTLSLAGYGGLVDDFAGTTINAQGSDLAEESLSLVSGGTSAGPFPGNGTYIELQLDLSAFSDPIVTFARRGTGSGFDTGTWSYSVQNAPFIPITGVNTATRNTTFDLATLDLTAINDVDLQSDVRLRCTLSGASSNSGNNRIDNLLVSATRMASGVPLVSIVATDSTASEAGQDPGTFRITRSGETATALAVSFTLSGSSATPDDYTPTFSGTTSIPVGESSIDITLIPVDDAAAEPSETVSVTLLDTAEYNLGGSLTATVTIADNDTAVAKIHDIQGSGSTFNTSFGGTQTIEGVVVAAFNGSSQLQGFFVQEEDADADGNPATSEGIFVFDPAGLLTGTVGDAVRVSGSVTEHTTSSSGVAGNNNSSLTQIIASAVVTLGPRALPAMTEVVLPVTNVSALERHEGMLVQVRSSNSPLVVTETFKLGRFGQVGLSGGSRLSQYTQVNSPSVAGYAAYLGNLLSNSIILDDASTAQNPDPVLHARGGQPLSATNTLRGGDTITNISGVLDERFEGYRVQTRTPANFVASNARSTVAAVGGNLRVASGNLLNFFNGNGAGGGFPTPRGANTPAEYERQRSKTVQAILGLDADIFGYNEIENDGYGSVSAVRQLVDALNEVAGAGTYDVVVPPQSQLSGLGGLGGDEITVGFIYKPARVRIAPATVPAALQSGIFDQVQSRVQRPAFAATFERLESGIPTGAAFTAVINHFKSKGSAANLPGDADANDGQGFSNATRLQASRELAAWLATSPTGTTDPDYLILGDLNAYRLEDPIIALIQAGYVSLFGPESYSFQFNGHWGSLDHALANASLARQVTGAVKWPINADEPVSLDYNTEFKSASQVSAFYAPDAYRSSDHDPLLVGLSLLPANQPPTTPDQVFIRGAGLNLKIPIADLLAGASDPEGGTLSLTGIGASLQGATISTNETQILYSISGNLDDEFPYSVSDSQGGSGTGKVRVQVVDTGGKAQSLLLAGASVQVHFAGVPGLSYDVQRATTPIGPWVTLAAGQIAPPNGLFRFTDPDLPQTSAFYRLSTMPTP